jgi:glycosyltransferase involved in cell wall biosynthesis
MTLQISVCVPTYNGEKFLRECLDGIEAQTFGDFEVLVVDDVSSDGTLDIINEYARRDRRFRVFRNAQNLGLVGNWNRCLELAEGEWIKFVFQDDTIERRCLEKLIARSHSTIALTACSRSFIYENLDPESQASLEAFLEKHSLAALFPEGGYVSAARFCRAALERPAVNFIGEPTAVMFHRSARERFGVFNADFVQLCDFEYWARIACHEGLNIVPEVLAGFRIHRDSKSIANRDDREFRTEIVDPLLLNYEFGYASYYSPIRAVARRLEIDLQRSIAAGARKAELRAQRMARDMLTPDLRPLAEWKSIVSAYPKLSESRYGRLDKWNDGLDRHVTWRFRANLGRFKKSGLRCPVILNVDIEPDDLWTSPGQPLGWRGFELLSQLFSSVRPLLATATEVPVHYTWSLRMDQQIAQAYGSPDWIACHYKQSIQQHRSEGDELGINTRAYRWDPAGKHWLSDYNDHAWLDACVRLSLDTFHAALGRRCESFRFCEWMSNHAAALLESLHIRFDMSLHRGQHPTDMSYQWQALADGKVEHSQLPAMPYRPALADFTKHDATRGRGLWMIPLSAALVSEGPARSPTGISRMGLNMESAPEEFEFITNRTLSTYDRPYLALTLSSAVAVNPRLLRNVKMNFSSFLMHPLADRFVFSTPAEAMAVLGYGD